MNKNKVSDCRNHKKKDRARAQHAWMDHDKKIISFHQIESGQLLEAEEPLFWEKIIILCRTGYRVQ